MLFSRLYKTHKYNEHGAVFIELALVIFLLFFVLGGVLDYGFYYKEQFVIEEAARFAANTVDYYPTVELPPDEENSGDTVYDQNYVSPTVQYSKNRFQEGIVQARNYIGNSGLNPEAYTYDIWGESPVLDCNAGGFVTIRIKAKSGANRFTVAPSWAFQTCTMHKIFIEGRMLCHRQGFTKHDGNGMYVERMPNDTVCGGE